MSQNGIYKDRLTLKEYEWDKQKKRWNRVPIDRETLARLSERNTWNGLWRLALYLFFLGAAGLTAYFVSTINLWLSIPFFYLYFTVYGFLIAIAHELQHRTVFSKKFDQFGDALCYVIMFFMWTPPSYTKVTHRLHHRYTMVQSADPETDWPKVMDLKFLYKFTWSMALDILLVRLPFNLLRDVWKLLSKATSYKDHTMKKYCTEKEIAAIRLESGVYFLLHSTLIFCAIYFQWWYLLVYITVAWQIGFPIELIWHNTEHLGKCYNVNDQRLCTRSVKVSFFTHLIYWGLDIHVEHHLYPAVPSYKLPELHQIIKDQVPEPQNVIACWKEIFATARQKGREPQLEYIPDCLKSEKTGF